MLQNSYFFSYHNIFFYFFFLGIDVAGDTKSTTYYSTRCTQFCFKLIRVKRAKRHQREGTEK